VSTRSGPGEKHQAVFADLDLVAVGQRRRLHRFTVEIGAVEAADVDYREFAILQPELGVASPDGDVVEEDVAAGMTAGGGDRLIQSETRSGVGAALDDNHGRAAWQPVDSPHPRLGSGSGRRVQLA
jgi:hypothetical protein